MMQRTFFSRLIIFNLTMLACILSSCQSQHNSESSQVLARVNNEEITVHQLNAESLKIYHSSQPQPLEQDKVIEHLIENTLFKQALFQENLNRKLAFVPSIANATTEAYAEVYKSYLMRDLPPPTTNEILQYQQSHPEYFERRQLFAVNEIKIVSDLSIYDVEFLAFKAKNFAKAIDWLHEHKVNFVNYHHFLTTDQLHAAFFQKNKQLAVDAMIVFNEAGNIHLQAIKPMMPAPIAEADAFFIAKERLMNKRRDDKISNELAGLKAIANIRLSEKQKE